jgi:hypothetical protein
MKCTLRKLSIEGVKKFEFYLDDLRKGKYNDPPRVLLDDPAYSEVLPWSVEVETKEFKSRYDMGTYLVTALAPSDQKSISHDIGVWTWLSLFYFDQLCPKGAGDVRTPRETYNYILSKDFRHRERHAIRTTYYFVKNYNGKVVFMFSKGLSKRGEIIEQLSQRQDFLKSRGVIEAASFLYTDSAKNTFRRGAAGKGKGAARRFVKVIKQFDTTYDLFHLSGDQLIQLLPKEFEKFKEAEGRKAK